MEDYIKVEGHSDLVRDSQTTAIINSNKEEYQNYIYSRKRKLAEIEKMQQMENQIDTLTDEISEMKNLLTKILEKL